MAQAPKTDFLDEPVMSQEELNAMFSEPQSKGELIPPQPRGRDLGGGAELLIRDVVTAIRVEVPRDEAKILQKLASVAAFAGDEVLLYRWPVKNRRTGKETIVEGPTVKCAYAIQRCYGNSRTDIASVDIGNAWIFKAVFSDFEAGVQTARLFQQHKGVAKIGGEDDARRLDMSFQIGQSKAIRNAIVAHLELPFVVYMTDVARENLVARIGQKIEHYRSRIAARLAEIDVAVSRVERTVGKPLAAWLAPDIARVITEIKAVADGMALASESWPVEAPPEPRRSDTTTDVVDQTGVGTSQPPEGVASESKPSHPVEEASHQTQPESSSPPPVNDDDWRIPSAIVGQENVLTAINVKLREARLPAHVDAIERANAERIAKISGIKRQQLDDTIRVARERVKG